MSVAITNVSRFVCVKIGEEPREENTLLLIEGCTEVECATCCLVVGQCVEVVVSPC
jgi:hypothetical protein